MICFSLRLLFILVVSTGIVHAEPTPNIILCMTDDQGWGDVSYNGLTKIKTPNLDAMAAAGLRFNSLLRAAKLLADARQRDDGPASESHGRVLAGHEAAEGRNSPSRSS